MWQRLWRSCCMVCLLAVACGMVAAQNLNTPIALSKGQFIAFLGDSITQQNLYTRYLELMLNAQYPDLELRFVNVGWSGRHSSHVMDDGVLNRDLLRLHPDVVFILFGMNDGWYRNPPAPQAMALYQNNMESLVSKIQRALPDVRIILLSPTACDPANSTYLQGYNNTLGNMAQYVSDLAARRNLPFIDLYKPMLRVDAAGKAADATFTMTIDGVHPTPPGHWLIATLIDNAININPTLRVRTEMDAKSVTAVVDQAKIDELRTQDGGLVFTQTLPRALVTLPLDARAALNYAPIQASRDKGVLVVNNLNPDTLYGIYINNALFARVYGSDLAAGIEWTTPRQEDPFTARMLELAMTKYQYRWTAWRAQWTGLAEIDPTLGNSDEWKAFDAAMNGLVARADTEEHQLALNAKVTTWRIMPERLIDLPKWEVTGPFSYQSFNTAYPPEAGVTGLNWSTMKSVNDYLDFSPTYGWFRNGVVYARVRVYVPRDAQLSISAGSDAGIKIWVNGTICIAHDIFRSAQLGQDNGTAPLQAGWNTIVARELRGNQGWGLYLRAYLSGLSAEEMDAVRVNPE